MITWRHCANMTSGYARPEAPGEAWAYNDYNIQLYWKCLAHAYGEPLSVVWRRSFAALGQQYATPMSDNGFVWGSVDDYARIGWMWCQGGRWGNEQIIPADLFTDLCHVGVSDDIPISAPSGDAGLNDYLHLGSWGGGSNTKDNGPGRYGGNWWFNAKGDFLPDLPHDAFFAAGAWNKYCWVVPSAQLVFVFGEHWQDIRAARSRGEADRPSHQAIGEILKDLC